jgi:hypothetical protein
MLEARASSVLAILDKDFVARTRRIVADSPLVLVIRSNLVNRLRPIGATISFAAPTTKGITE